MRAYAFVDFPPAGADECFEIITKLGAAQFGALVALEKLSATSLPRRFLVGSDGPHTPESLTELTKMPLDLIKSALIAGEDHGVVTLDPCPIGQVSLVVRFVAARCVKGEEQRVGTAELWRAFRSWCQAEGGHHLFRAQFRSVLEGMGFRQNRSKQRRVWQGISVL